MNVHIPDHIRAIKDYNPGKTIAQLKEEFGWEKTAILWNNENTLGVSQKAMAAVNEVSDGVNYYPDPTGFALRRRLALRLEKKPENIILGNGSESILMLAIKALCSGEDEFLTSEGSFVIIYNWAKINNTRCVSMPMSDTYGFDLEAIKSRITINTKLIYLANANNPTGTKISKEELVSFMRMIPDHIMVIVDETYFEFSIDLDPTFPNSIELKNDNMLTLRTFSKAYGIAGVRIGYAIGHPKIIEAMNKVRLTFEPSTLAQAAGIGALQDEDFLEKTVRNNTTGMKYLYEQFDRLDIKYVPSYGNFVMTVWDSSAQAKEVTQKLMHRGVLVRGLEGNLAHCIRITIGRPDELEWLVKNLEFLQKV